RAELGAGPQSHAPPRERPRDHVKHCLHDLLPAGACDASSARLQLSHSRNGIPCAAAAINASTSGVEPMNTVGQPDTITPFGSVGSPRRAASLPSMNTFAEPIAIAACPGHAARSPARAAGRKPMFTDLAEVTIGVVCAGSAWHVCRSVRRAAEGMIFLAQRV